MYTVVTIQKVREAYQRAYDLSRDHDAACRAVASALGIAVESVRDAIAIIAPAATS